MVFPMAALAVQFQQQMDLLQMAYPESQWMPQCDGGSKCALKKIEMELQMMWV